MVSSILLVFNVKLIIIQRKKQHQINRSHTYLTLTANAILNKLILSTKILAGRKYNSVFPLIG